MQEYTQLLLKWGSQDWVMLNKHSVVNKFKFQKMNNVLLLMNAQ